MRISSREQSCIILRYLLEGNETPIRDVDRLVRAYGGKAEDWQKVKGIGTIVHNGEEGSAEIHWYQVNGSEKEEIKFKRYVDES